ncbi:Uncharacterised protein [Acinetobacter baumannii]|nr:Uncharacterised protein [Acinetobacter baumannii]
MPRAGSFLPYRLTSALGWRISRLVNRMSYSPSRRSALWPFSPRKAVTSASKS